MRVISLRFGNTGISIKKTAGNEVLVRTKNEKMVFSLDSGFPEPVNLPVSIDEELVKHIQWAINNYFGSKKID